MSRPRPGGSPRTAAGGDLNDGGELGNERVHAGERSSRARLRRMRARAKRSLRIGRFAVMATLQAARAKRLGLPDESAFSWGLNRAIFYAAAKRGFRSGQGERGPHEALPEAKQEATYYLGDEMAYRDPASSEPRFTIGGETQTKADFDRQVAARFGTDRNFRSAWREAQEIIAGFDEETLGSRSQFFSQVYKPRRDELATQWTEKYIIAPAPAGQD